MSAERLVERLRSYAEAYPTDIFPELAGDESDALHLLMPGTIDRISAAMGRHCSKIMLEAADALEAELPAFVDLWAGPCEVVDDGAPFECVMRFETAAEAEAAREFLRKRQR